MPPAEPVSATRLRRSRLDQMFFANSGAHVAQAAPVDQPRATATLNG